MRPSDVSAGTKLDRTADIYIYMHGKSMHKGELNLVQLNGNIKKYAIRIISAT